MDSEVIKKRNLTTLAVAAVLALVVAACDTSDTPDVPDAPDSPVDSPFGDDSDDATEVDTPEATDDADVDDGTDDADDVARDDQAADDDAAADDVTDDVATDDVDDGTEAAESDDAATDDADEILDRAAERFAELETARFELDGTGYLELDEIGEISLSDAEGKIERPDRAEIDIKVDSAIADVPVTVISYNGEVYIADPVAGSTHSAPDDFQFNPAIMFDEDQGIPALIRSVEDAELLADDEEVDGRDAYKIYGMIDGDMIQAATAGMFPETDDVDFNVWIDRETYDVLKILAEDPTDETDAVWEMGIFDHNEPVEIDDPS